MSKFLIDNADYIITAGQWLSAMAMIPSVVGPNKPAWLSSALTAAILVVFSLTFESLGLRWSAMAASLCGFVWVILLIQAMRIKARKCGLPLPPHWVDNA